MTKELTLSNLYHLPQDAKERLEGKTFVGIDFGTSTTVVSIATFDAQSKSIRCESLQLEQMLEDGTLTENELLPTVMAKMPNRLLVGEGAYQLKGNPDYEFGHNIWHSFKMELGKDMGPRWTSITDLSLIKSPFDATTVFFKYLKREIEKAVVKRKLPKDIKYAVSIPASFESNQRLDLLRALENNGIEIGSNMLIDEPNAAFIGYINPDNTFKEPIILHDGYNPKVLVFDFGAGTCDISILELRADYQGLHTKNISISQFTELGGNDIDRFIVYNFILPELLKNNGIADSDFNTKQIDIIANQLLGVAEHLKIQCSKDFTFLLSDEESLNIAIKNGQCVSYTHPMRIYTELKDLEQNNFKLTYEQFMEAMEAFLNKKLHLPKRIKNQKRYNSIYATIDSAIRKAHVDKNQIDYVMMIGGSSKNPYVQKCIREYFPHQTHILIPQDLQSLVSQGAAIHSLLVNGLQIVVVRPITSEPIVVVLRGDQEQSIIPAGTEIPIGEVKVQGLGTGDYDQSVIEIPICVTNSRKVVANVKIEDPLGVPFPRNTPIQLSLEIDADKVLKVSAICLGQECNIASENPFANTYLTDDEKKILKAERETYVSADRNNGVPTRQSLENLRQAYVDADKEFQAAETYEQQLKYYPQDNMYNYIGVLFHNSGNYGRAIKYFKKALEIDNNNAWAHSNLGNDLYIIGNNEEAKEHLEKALELRPEQTTAMSILGDIYRDAGDKEKANEYYNRCFNIYNRKWKDGGLGEVDYGWFENVAHKLGKHGVAREIAASKPQKHHNQNYNSQNLITLQGDKETTI